MNAPTPQTLQALLDERDLIRVVDEIDNATDAKDWDRCRSYFADNLQVDFTSLAGGQPGPMKADDLVGAWRSNLTADKKSHHMRSNHRVSIRGDQAEVFSKGYAFNLLPSRLLPNGQGSDLWEVWGTYRHTLQRTAQGWKCSGMTFTVTYARGNDQVRTYVPGASAR